MSRPSVPTTSSRIRDHFCAVRDISVGSGCTPRGTASLVLGQPRQTRAIGRHALPVHCASQPTQQIHRPLFPAPRTQLAGVRLRPGAALRAGSGSGGTGGGVGGTTTATEPRKGVVPSAPPSPSKRSSNSGGNNNNNNKNNNSSRSAATPPPAMDEDAGTAAASVLQAQQRQQDLPDDAIPLMLHRGAVVCPATGPVLDALHPGARLNTAASADGAAVLGLAAPAVQGPTSSMDITIGKLAPGRLLACARSKLWWMTPEWRTSTRTLPPETQFLLAELRPGGQGPYALLLPLIDGDFRATLRPAMPRTGAEGELVLRVESGDERVTAEAWQSLLHVSVGWDPYALVERGVAAAAALSGGARPRTSKALPPSLDVFGWCTWDAFYSSVSAKGIQEGLAKLHDDGIRPRFLIIDDGWQMTDLDPPGLQPPTSPAQLAEALQWMPEEERALLRSTADDFYMESMEVLAETAVTLPSGTSAATSMPMLSSLGPGGARAAHHSHHAHAATEEADGNVTPSLQPPKPQQLQQQGQEGQRAAALKQAAAAPVEPVEPNPAALLMTRLGQKVAGWVVGLGTAAFLLGYQWLVEPAPPGSLPVRGFAALANGPLRGAMLGFYSNASDFTRRLTSVKANAKFSSPDAGPDEPWTGKPERLGEVVAAIKARFGVSFVYCWHALSGYWAGIMPGAIEVGGQGASVMYARPTAGVLEVEPSMAWNPAVLAGVGVLTDPTGLYNAMHSYLSSAGVDGVKVDCQAGVGLAGSALGGGPALSRAFHAALEDSIATHFANNHAINCMCHSTENLYRLRGTAIARASDDFYPRDPASSQPHIAACAYNSVFLSALVQPDWDMFHSKHPAASLHAIARAISGGPVYVSDKPGEHDPALLRKLVLPDGSLLRCSGPGRPTRDCLFSDVLRDGRSVLKVWNVNLGPQGGQQGAAPLLSGVVAALHLQGSSWDRNRRKFFVHDPRPRDLDTTVSPRDVEAFGDLPAGAASKFAAYVHGQPASSGLRVLEWGGALPLRLKPATGELVTFAPIVQCGDVAFAALGLMDMFNSGGAVTAAVPSPNPAGGAVVTVGVRGSGPLLLYASRKPRGVRVCGLPLMFEWWAASSAFTVVVPPTVDLKAEVVVEWESGT